VLNTNYLREFRVRNCERRARFPTAVFESQEAMITREAADLLNKVLRVALGISGPFLVVDIRIC
jgi:hypothetical protein